MKTSQLMTNVGMLFGVSAMSLAIQNAIAEETQIAKPLEHVIVVGQKREQNLQDVPLAISAVSAKEIEEAHLDSILDITEMTLGITFDDSDEIRSANINIRGAGSSQVGTGIEPSAVVVVDGEIFARSAAVTGDLSDPERVEILRGPQGTLFGKNVSSGLIHTITKRPQLDDGLDGYIQVGVAEDDDYSLKGAIASSFGENLAFRINAFTKDQGGWIRNTYKDNPNGGAKESSGVRAQLLYSPITDLEILFRVDHSQTDTNRAGSVIVEADAPDNAFFTLTGQEFGPDAETNTQDRFMASEVETTGVSAEVNWSLGEYQLVAQAYTRDWELIENKDPDSSALILSRASFAGLNTADTKQLEVRIVSPAEEKYDYIAGVFAYQVENRRDAFNQFCNRGTFDAQDRPNRIADIDPDTLEVISCNGPGGDPYTNLDTVNNAYTVDNYALFGHFNYHINNDLTLFAGARWLEEQSEHRYSGGTENIENFMNKESDNAFIYKVGGQFNVTDDFMVYASYSTGYKGGAVFNTVNATEEQISNPIDPEEAKAYEVGFRADLFDKVRWNTTIFRTDFNDFQERVRVDTDDSPDDENFETLFVNAGTVRTQGLETEVRYEPISSLTLNLGLAYLESFYIDDSNTLAVICSAASSGLDDSSLSCVAQGDANVLFLDGVTRPNTPEWSVNANARYRFDLGAFPSTLAFSYKYVDDQTKHISHDIDRFVEAQDIANLNFNIKSPKKKYDLSLYVKNLFDDRQVTARNRFPEKFGGGHVEKLSRYYERTFGATFRARL